jgi:hypothetical protein
LHISGEQNSSCGSEYCQNTSSGCGNKFNEKNIDFACQYCIAYETLWPWRTGSSFVYFMLSVLWTISVFKWKVQETDIANCNMNISTKKFCKKVNLRQSCPCA